VTVALPQDVQAEAWDYPAEFFADRVWEIERPQPDPRLLDRCAELLLNASRPLLVAGGGVWYADASDELEEFSALAGVPVAETFAGKGALNTDSWRQLGALGVEGTRVSNRAANETDLVLCVGTRMADFATGSQSLFKHPDVRFVGINVNAHDAHKQSAMAVRGDAKLTLRALIEATRAAGRKPDPSYQEAIERDRAEWRETIRLNLESGDGLSHGKLITALNAHARAGDVIITAAGAPPGELLKLWDATDDRRCHIEFGYSCMGYELPAGLGARLARPDGRVVVLVGDGSFMINAGEVATLVQEEARVTVVIIDNGGYQIIRRLQEKKTGTTFGNEFRHRSRAWDVETDLETAVAVEDEGQYLGADLTLVAEGLGARALRAGNEEELREALEAADAHDGPTVIVVSVEQQWWLPESGSWWDIAPAEVASDEATMASRREYEQGRSSELRYYFPSGTRMPAETTS
jgi:3D-(3,5/4)-trihydroxycyclohexane-1,2-dione acylhydrolase (decyclizing)